MTFIPEDHLDKVREAVFNAGAGFIGNYDRCGFTVSGTGSFRAGEGTNPFAGKKGKMHFEKEIRFETIFFSHLKEKVINALLDAHPYEEVAYDIYSLENDNIDSGLGCTGEFAEPVSENDFLNLVSSVFDAHGITLFSTDRQDRLKKLPFAEVQEHHFYMMLFQQGQMHLLQAILNIIPGLKLITGFCLSIADILKLKNFQQKFYTI